MRRLNVVLFLLALGLAVPVGILVSRALASAALEEENRHRLIAERAFDEMESTLSRFLAEEEARPFDAYRFYPAGEAPNRSPLAEPPGLPFVLGYFQIDPDGSLHTPRVPRDLDAAVARGDFTPSSQTTQLPNELQAAWREAGRMRPQPELGRGLQAPPALRQPASSLLTRSREASGQRIDGPEEFAKEPSAREADSSGDWSADRLHASAAPEADRIAKDVKNRGGTTGQSFAAQSKSKSRPKKALQDADSSKPESEPEAKAEAPDSYDVYRSFNLATKRRQERQQKVQSVPRRALPPPPSAPSAPSAKSSLPPSARPATAAQDSPALAGALAEAVAPRDEEGRVAAARAEAEAEQAATIRVAVDPMNGRATSDDRLVLYRTVVADEQGYRQGLLVDWRKLGTWLHAQVIEPSGVGQAGARALFFAADADPTQRPDEISYAYRHPFAEPFDAFAVELQLPALPGGRGTGTIHALAALLVGVAVAGLFAVHRMVRIVVQFAERRSRFAASVSHELKTPLTSIRMYGEMLRDGLVPSEAKRAEYYHTITDESERLSRLIDNVLDFSRLEKGEYEARTTPGDIGPVVQEAVDKLRPHMSRHDFEIELDLAADLPQVLFDRDGVTQIVFNLVDNARKYASDGPQRTIQIHCHADAGGVSLSVRDFGPGVPDRDLGRIFEAFYRRDDEGTRTTRGTGIGLALVKELAESMGGTVRAENAAGGGLRVSLRLSSAARPTPSSQASPASPSS